MMISSYYFLHLLFFPKIMVANTCECMCLECSLFIYVTVQTVPNLQWFNLTMFRLYHGVKAIHIQEKLYFTFWMLYEVRPSLILSSSSELSHSSQPATPSGRWTTDTLTTIMYPYNHCFSLSVQYSISYTRRKYLQGKQLTRD